MYTLFIKQKSDQLSRSALVRVVIFTQLCALPAKNRNQSCDNMFGTIRLPLYRGVRVQRGWKMAWRRAEEPGSVLEMIKYLSQPLT